MTNQHNPAHPSPPEAGDRAGATPRQERRDAAAHRQRILAVARELFGRQGVDATSMHEIAQVAGVGQGTLYRRYAHKGDLCNALLQESMGRFRDEVDAQLAGCSATTAGLAQLAFLLGRLVQFNEENAPLLGAVGDAACGSRRSATYQTTLYVWLRETVLLLLRRAVEQGAAAPLDLDLVADAVLAPLAIELYLYQRRERGYTPERITHALRQLLFDGLAARPDATNQG